MREEGKRQKAEGKREEEKKRRGEDEKRRRGEKKYGGLTDGFVERLSESLLSCVFI